MKQLSFFFCLFLKGEAWGKYCSWEHQEIYGQYHRQWMQKVLLHWTNISQINWNVWCGMSINFAINCHKTSWRSRTKTPKYIDEEVEAESDSDSENDKVKEVKRLEREEMAATLRGYWWWRVMKNIILNDNIEFLLSWKKSCRRIKALAKQQEKNRCRFDWQRGRRRIKPD